MDAEVSRAVSKWPWLPVHRHAQYVNGEEEALCLGTACRRDSGYLFTVPQAPPAVTDPDTVTFPSLCPSA